MYRVGVSGRNFKTTAVTIAAPQTAAPAYQARFGEGNWPADSTPIRPTIEFRRMKGAESAAACLGEAQWSTMSNGARNTPPPTPVRPDTKPTTPPTSVTSKSGGG